MLIREISFLVSSSLLLYSFFPEHKTIAFSLWPFIFVWSWLKWFCRSKLNIPFTLDLLRFLPHAKTFSDSIRYMSVHRTLILSIPVFALSFLLLKPSVALWLPLWILSALLQIPFRKKQTAAPKYQWKFPSERSQWIDPKYPLLRHTLSFTGAKRFEVQRGEKPHVIMLFLESFRAKNIGCLGGLPGRSPQFDLLSEKGALFTQFYANGLQTYRAMISSFFGIPGHTKTMSLQPFCSLPMIGLPQILKANGYQTALYQGSPSTFDWTFPFLHKAGFETILGCESFPSEQKTSWGITDEALFYSAAGWLEKQTSPTFLSLFTISNHHPWQSPLKFPTPNNLPEPYRRYLETFSYSDHCLGLFIERLKQTGVLDKSIVFILGDHGQEMGERNGTFAFHNDLYQENIHIPLLILGGQKALINEPASQVDLLPTVLDALNIQATHHSVGRSLLREGNSPVFVSMPRKEPLIGCINKTHKVLLGQREECYNLSTDPEEKKGLPILEEIKQETESYFQSIEQLFKDASWAPASMEPPSAILDLSHSINADFAVFDLGKEKARTLHECNFAHCPLLSDAALFWIAKNCPNLVILNLSGCPLITHEGVEAIINQCISLRSLNIEGNSEITGTFIKKETALESLHLKNCPQIDGEALTHIANYCPRLIYLAASLQKTQDIHLNAMAEKLNQLSFIWIENGTSISETALNAFLEANPKLRILIADNFPNLERSHLLNHPLLHSVKFSRCPNLTDATLESLEKLDLRDLALISCPKITLKGLKKINPNCKITIDIG